MNKSRKIAVAIGISFLLMLIPEIVSQLIQRFILFPAGINEDRYGHVIMLIGRGLCIIAAVLYCKFKKLNYCNFEKDGIVKRYGIGFVVGIVMIFVTWIIPVIHGSIAFSFIKNPDINLILLFLLGYLIQGMSEEVIIRGYLQNSLKESMTAVKAIIASSFLFSVLHLGNSNVQIIPLINIFLFGVVMGLIMEKTGSLWVVGAIHSAWNFFQGNFFGVEVSGMPSQVSVVKSISDLNHTLMNGGLFGLEGSLVASVVLIITILLTIKLKFGKKIEISNNSKIQNI